jgi:transcriptional regulator with XRE-family HTH domain
MANAGRRYPMTKTIRQLREERGESEMQLAHALGATLSDIQDLEEGIASPSVTRLRLLTEHFGVREEEIDLEPGHPPSLGERLGEALAPE